jgi:hypothetical protein
MLKLTRLLMLIAAAALAAGPVMACCLTGHTQSAALYTSTETLPCHDAASPSGHEDAKAEQPAPLPVDCPECVDCDSAVMQAQSFDHSVSLTQLTPEVHFAVIAARFEGFEHKATILATGPPGDPPLPLSTPMSLKQRLLI